MSAFQIPGLGQAKPNETLPPLPTDVPIVAANAVGDEDMKDAPQPVEEAKPPPVQTGENADLNEPEKPNEEKDTDTMVIDHPESPPSLTHALEAALGGLDEVNTTQQQEQQDQPQQENQAQPQGDGTVELQNDQGENPEWEVDSSPYESSSESSSSDSSSDEDSDKEAYELLGVEETARLLMEMEGGSDDEGDRAGKGTGSNIVRTKNEVPEEVIPKPDVTVTPEMKIEELGAVEHIVDSIMVVKAITPGEYQVLDTGSVLCTADRVVIGVVSETIGKVLQPLYTVLFNSEAEIKELGLELGTKVFYPVDHASYVFTQPLRNAKGSDASNLHDEEVADEEMEFSDDEKEAEYKRSLKQKKKDKWKSTGGKGPKEPHPLRQGVSADGGLNYDDDEDGPYKPLARPADYGSRPGPSESYEPSPRPGNQRGRRGDFGGRGGRGRGSNRGGRGGYGAPRDGHSLPPQGHQQQYPSQPHQYPPQPPSSGGAWGNNPGPSIPSLPAGVSVPAMPNFGFQMPGWNQMPPQGQSGAAAAAAPPPPPGWPGHAQGQGQAANGAFVNPAFFAALMSQMQAQGGQPAWGAQPPPPPPPGGHGQ